VVGILYLPGFILWYYTGMIPTIKSGDTHSSTKVEILETSTYTYFYCKIQSLGTYSKQCLFFLTNFVDFSTKKSRKFWNFFSPNVCSINFSRIMEIFLLDVRWPPNALHNGCKVIMGYVTCYLACYVPFGTRNMGGYGCKTWQGEQA